MGNNYNLNLDYLTDSERDEFLALVSKIAERQHRAESKGWKPEIGESYFAIESSECADRRIVNYCVDSDYDKFNIAIGNCFRTRVEAEFAVEKLKVITEMKRYIAEHDNVGVDWTAHLKTKYGLGYNYGDDSPFIAVAYNVNRGGIYAGDAIVMENMIKEIGKDRIKKYYFGIE